ncbi:MAG: glycosyltransferase family 9 protein [Deltaproteobacteria bacterium]|nr:glycosyltransferase family 9 protein [Deltaproteobacteria bacterium]
MKKILFIRRDNIGDLICTTPAIHALREKFPKTKIGILVNTYNADAVAGNPDIDEVYVYEKAKHAKDKNRFSVWLENLRLLLKIRKEKYDVAIGCGYKYSTSLARYTFLTGANNRIGYVKSSANSISYNISMNEPSEPVHEVVATFKLLEPLGISGEPSNLVLLPSDDEKEKVLKCIPHPNLIAMHISSRKENNRWPADSFIELGNKLMKKYNVMPLILWAPGSSKNPFHPGDDEMAYKIAAKISGAAVYKTTRLGELIAAISLCKLTICCDGGAMHIAAALGKPVLTIWGSTDKRRWALWKAEGIILQKGLRADEISVEEALVAFERMWRH